MKILIINYTNCYLETLELTPEEEDRMIKAYEEGDKHMVDGESFAREFEYQEAERILAEREYEVPNQSFSILVADDIPVYSVGEAIPYYTL